jgi:thiamine-monophosphate kinase
VDPVIYQRHFDDTVPPARVGEKLLKRNLSDLAAMGAKPTVAVVALMLDPTVRTAWLEQFYRGLGRCAQRYGVSIVGGDIAQANSSLAASLTLLGQVAGKRMVTRDGGRKGDWIYVTGTLGGSLLGKHYHFEPRLKEGAWLAKQREVRAMMDLSDVLAKDHYALTPKGMQASLQPERLPISAAARRLAQRTGRSVLDHAVSDGEDFELLCVIDAKANRAALEQRWSRTFKLSFRCIGQFVPACQPLPGAFDLHRFHGYEHLR